jgi:eukaryotic-like serine/threonine-protein kinase
MINLDRWNEIKEIVQHALDLPPGERPAYLDNACNGDEELRREVDALLAVSSVRADFFDDFQVLPSSMQTVSLEEDDFIGPYRIIRPLGKGGMGAVYLAQDSEHDRLVALKTVPRRSERVLLQEKRLLAKLQHHNIATLYDSGQTKEGFGYFVMEYVEGESITTYCDTHRLTVRQRLELFLAVCDAVSFAHRNLVIHRDIKPKNILVTKDGEPKLLDFGIAQVLPSMPALEALTQSGERSFTVAFASPEQLSGEHTTTATDIYSLGILLCALLTGRLPYPVKRYEDLPFAISNLEPEKPSQLLEREDARLDTNAHLASDLPINSRKFAKQLRGDLDAIVLRALEKDANERYQSVQELADDIHRHISNRPVSACGTSRWYRTAKYIRRRRWTVAAVVTVFFIFVTATFLLLLERNRTLEQERRAVLLNTFLLDIFSRLDPAEGQGQTTTTGDLLRYAAHTLKSRRDLAPPDRLPLVCTLSNVYLSLGLYDDAINLMQPSLKDIERLSSSEPEIAHHCLLQLSAGYLYTDNLQAADQFATQAQNLADARMDSGLARAQALHTRAVVKWKQGNFSQADSLYTAAIQLKRQLGEEHQDQVASTLSALGVLLTSQGEYDRADKLLKESLSIRRRVLPPVHPDTAETLFNRGIVLHRQGKYAEARAVYTEALSIYLDLFGKEHPRAVSILNSIGALQHGEGNLDLAERTLREALAIVRRTRSEESPRAASVMNNLAALLRDKGEHAEAEPLYQKVLAIDQRIFGAHPNTANTLSNLGTLYNDIGQHEKSVEHHERALGMLRTTVGPEHPATGATLNRLAVSLKALGRVDEAEAVYREAIAISRKNLGPSHLDVIVAENNLASLLRDQGKVKEAKQLLVPALAKATSTLGEDHQHVATFRMNLARLYNLEGNYKDARREVESARQSLIRALPADHVLIAKADGTLGESLTGLGEFDKAEPLLLRSFSRIQEVEGSASPSRQLALERIVRLYNAWGKPKKEADYRKLMAGSARSGR